MEATLSQRIAARLRAERARQRLTIREVEARSGVPAPSLYRYFSGARAFPLDALGAVCEALGVDVEDLLADDASRLVAS